MHDGKIINVDGVYHWSGVDRIFFRTPTVFVSIETHAGMRRHTETVMSPPETPVAQALHPDRVGFSSITTSGALRYRFNHRRCPPHTCSIPSLIASLFTSTDLQIWENQGCGASYFLICFHLFTSEFCRHVLQMQDLPLPDAVLFCPKVLHVVFAFIFTVI